MPLSIFLAIAATCILLLLCAAAHAVPPTKADIPSDLPPDLKQLIEQTFADDLTQRATAVQKLGSPHDFSKRAKKPPVLTRASILKNPYV
jgi:hypothetical protein